MLRARTALALTVGAALAFGLTACDKPNPNATVFSGTVSRSQQAACWGQNGESINLDACAKDVLDAATTGSKLPTIPVLPGQTIGVSVDPSVADAGWQLLINNQTLNATPVTSTYFRFTFPDFQQVPADGILLEVLAGGAGTPRGIWLYRLVAA
jgi:hypothetical protein